MKEKLKELEARKGQLWDAKKDHARVSEEVQRVRREEALVRDEQLKSL